uniref:Uncharacterized protein n=1 Tax=Alexandrium catenella TaxID=2925 RepID=A0A7S1RSC5_ALECA
MYDKMVCWCETNEKEKTQAIADADAKDLELSSEVEGRAARFGNLATEIAQMKDQIAEDTEALKQATAIREKTAGEFRGDEKDLVQAVDNLRNAIAVLSKHHGGSLLQVDVPIVSGMRVLLRDAALKYEVLRAGSASRGHGGRAVAGLLQTAVQAGASSENEELHSALLSALDAHGAGVPDALPLAMAERLVAEEAHTHSGTAGSFLQAGARQPIDAAYKSYNSRSGAIFGIMNQMLEEFTAQLGTSQKDDMKSTEDYQALAKAKKEQISTAKDKLDDLEGDHAANQKALSDAKEDLELTRKQRSADVEFVRKLKLTCNDLDKEWERRSATRTEELKAVAETIAVLTEDDNHEMLAKSVSLLQERQGSAATALRARVVAALRRAAATPAFQADDLLAAWRRRGGARSVGAAGGPRAHLSALAMTAQLDSFEKVKQMMDTMVTELKAQQKEEVEFKAYCAKEFDENEKATYSKNQQKDDLESKLDSLAALMTKLEKEIVAARKQIADTEVEIRKASENREAENKEFQQTVADQRATQTILTKALQRLRDFYSKGMGKKVIYLQRDAQTPPVQFTKYKDNAGSSPVMGLLESIIGDSVKLEKEATTGEYKAQADYEQFTKDSNALIADLSDSVATKSKAIADAKLDTAETESDLTSTISELESLADYKADLHGQCDFVMKNFDVRQKARLQEMEAIQAAKGILSGDRMTS